MSAAPASSTFVVLGAGSWGTALAIQLARLSRPTVLWGRDPAHVAALARQRCNERYLPQAEFPDSCSSRPISLQPCAPRRMCSSRFRVTRCVCCCRKSRRISRQCTHQLGDEGFELATGLLPHEVVRQVLGEGVPTAVVSGPTFAKEVGAGLPTAMTVAANDATFANDLAQRLSGMNFRAYTSTDMVGVETGGAIKNVLAIGAGISDGSATAPTPASRSSRADWSR
jgi:glycerol-3-phosphate dehydrogenase (NAD(P)+)